MVTSDGRILRNRLGVLQFVGLPLIRFVTKHTYLMMLFLRVAGIMENGIKRMGYFPMEVSAFVDGKIGQYKIRFWISPIRRDYARYSFSLIKI